MTWGERINNGKTTVTEQTNEIIKTLTGVSDAELKALRTCLSVEPLALRDAIRQAFLKGYQAHFRKETQP